MEYVALIREGTSLW